MKQYKGWELLKLADEGKIENCACFEYKISETNTGKVYYKNRCFYMDERYNIDSEYKISVFMSDHIFTKVQKPLNFFEAMRKVDEGFKVTNSSLIKAKNNGHYYKKDDGLYYKSIKLNDKFGIEKKS